ncbi:MAG: phosphodiester glycosidase family protein [Oscillospiraceae bacterium]|nr:phosphodiester glycosidase family protein [Oscillospiraceae bacterium]
MHSKRSKEIPLPVIILLDILMTALILGLFVLFQILIPARKSAAASRAKIMASQSETESKPEVALLSSSPSEPDREVQIEVADISAEVAKDVSDDTVLTMSETEASGDSVLNSAIESEQPFEKNNFVSLPEPTPDTRTPWQKQFADYFSDEIIRTENSYSSPNVAISIETRTFEEGSRKSVYHVADIHIGSIDCFKTYLSHGIYTYFDTQDVLEMDMAADALLAISGDFCTYQKTGFFVRNGEVVKDDHSWGDICVLYEDGTMECIVNGMYGKNEDLLEKGALQVWNFGPSLLDKNGGIRYDYTVSQSVMYPNPRSAIGYYEPGHYCFVVVDGRQEGYSKGMLLNELAGVFQELGCKCAYNLDGGGSAVMTFHHDRFSQQSNGADRMLGDILLIREPEE